MNRRDLVIVAVLVNAGLLIVLFASALKSNDAAQEVASAVVSETSKTIELPIKPKAVSTPVQTPASTPSQAVSKEETQVAAAPALPASPSSLPITQPSNAQAAPATTNFADDLQAITMQPQASSASSEVAAHPTAEKSQPEWIEVKVKKGDVLEKIARTNHTTVNDIMKQNNLSSSQLKVGQVLKISPSKKKETVKEMTKPATAAAKPESAKKAPGSAKQKYYTVKNGDNPWTIAVKNHMKLEDLLKLNNLTPEKARHLKPGDQLRVE